MLLFLNKFENKKIKTMLTNIKWTAIIITCLSLFTACKLTNKDAAKETDKTAVTQADGQTTDGHPSWIMQGNVYEVNVRQYTPEGTFAAFEKSLDRLKAMGVQTLWFMPINPISVLDRKGQMGSYYAVSDYTAINPEFGTLADWKNLVKNAHDKGMKVIIDWVPNHAGADHKWVTQHPDFFVKDSVTGKPAIPYDWTDTRQLDFKNTVMEDSMINAMKYWITNTDIDGFRCDVAWNVPASFWNKCIPQLRSMKNIFMLAEGDKPYLLTSGFDATYPWELFHKTVDVAAGKAPAYALDSIISKYDTVYPKNAIQLFFTSNHDENSWNKADYKTMPGAVHAPFAVLTQTLGHGVPLVYSGQEEPFLDSLSFFYKDNIGFSKYLRAPMYTTLQNLRLSTPALAANASCNKIDVGNKNALFAYVRSAGTSKVLVVLNLSAKAQKYTIADKALHSNATNVFTNAQQAVTAAPTAIEPWGYVVLKY
jgi:alpha-amylase